MILMEAGGIDKFNIRKIQEQALFEAVRKQSDAETADEIVYGEAEKARCESNAEWVKSAMFRLEDRFDIETTKQIRMNCQCGYGMAEKL